MRSRRYSRVALALLVVGLTVLVGCGTHNVSTIKTYELVTNYDRMTPVYEPRLSLVYVAPDAKLEQYQTLVIKPVTISGVWVSDQERAELFGPYVEQKLKDSIASTGAFEKIVVDAQYLKVADASERMVVLETVVTRLERGNGTARYFLQLGATDFQIEGRLVDARTRETLVEFAERRRDLGERPWDPSVKALDNEFTLKQTIVKVSDSVGDVLSELRKPKPAEAPAEVAEKAEPAPKPAVPNPS